MASLIAKLKKMRLMRRLSLTAQKQLSAFRPYEQQLLLDVVRKHPEALDFIGKSLESGQCDAHYIFRVLIIQKQPVEVLDSMA
jgi:hypothetical protein